MIRQFKLGIKLIRYTFGIKTCLGCAAVFLVLGIVLSFVSMNIGVMPTGSFFLAVTGMWITQMFCSLYVSGMIKASPWNKAIQTVMPTFLSFLGFAASYLLIILLKLPLLSAASIEMRQSMSAELVLDAWLMAIIMIYSGTAYKFFITSTLLFFVFFVGMSAVYGGILFWLVSRLPFGAAAVIGGLCLIVGAFLQYGLSVLVYKYPLSKRAQLRSLQKYM